METIKNKKEVYRIYLDEPGSPAYMVYDKKMADDLRERLVAKFGKPFLIALKEMETAQ